MTRYDLLRRGLAVADRILPSRAFSRLDAQALISAAGVEPTAAAREGLRQLMSSLATQSELTLFGRLTIRWDMIRLLRNAAMVERAHDDDPALATRPIAAPVFILGLPRSGTTFLHALLAADPDNLVPRNWQTIYPAPRRRDFDRRRDRRARKVDRQLKLFAGMAPGFAEAHPIDADSPQECSEITAHVFESLRFDTTFRVPGYLAWVDRHGDYAGLVFHKRFLQFLQRGLSGRWVLKCPDHTFSLDTILRVYPDARFVIVHRDPIDVFGSVAHLTEVLRRPFLRRIDATEIGQQVSERWVQGAQRLFAFDQRDDVAAARKFHVRYEELAEAPMAIVERLYAQFGIALRPEAEAAMAALLQARPRGGYARHAPYALKRFGINTDALAGRFSFYVDRYCHPMQRVDV